MSDFIHFIVVVGKLGIGLGVAWVAIVYLAYGIESHCWNPVGCIDNSPAAQERERDIESISKWGR